MKNINKYVLRQIFREADLEGFIKMGAPQNEYNDLADSIYNNMRLNHNIYNLAHIVYCSILRQFFCVMPFTFDNENIDKIDADCFFPTRFPNDEYKDKIKNLVLKIWNYESDTNTSESL